MIVAAWLVCSFAGIGTARAEAPIAIVVSERWDGLRAISIPVLRQAYLGRRTRLAGKRLRCLDLPAGSPARDAFARAVIGRSERAMERYWLRQALSGGAPPPREADTAGMLALVAREVGALGYLEWKGQPPPAGVRVLALEVGGRTLRPGDDGYPLHLSEAPSR